MKRTPLKRKTPLKAKPPSPKSKKTVKRGSSLKTLNATAMRLWGEACRVQAGDRCEWCGSVEMLQAHHMVKRSRSRLLRHDIRNACLVCARCHYVFHNQTEVVGWHTFRESRPDDYDYLLSKMRERCKPNKGFIESEIGILREWLSQNQKTVVE
jgi:hypothetical protein